MITEPTGLDGQRSSREVNVGEGGGGTGVMGRSCVDERGEGTMYVIIRVLCGATMQNVNVTQMRSAFVHQCRDEGSTAAFGFKCT